MSYRGPSVAKVLKHAAPDKKLAKDMGDRVGRFLVDRVQAHTPVRTGEARESVYKTPTVVMAAGDVTFFEVGAASDLHRMLWLEYGTRPHEITGRRGQALAFKVGGRTVFARRVNHPGTKGLHMFAVAAAETEAMMDRLLDPILRRWTLEVEAKIDREGRSHG